VAGHQEKIQVGGKVERWLHSTSCSSSGKRVAGTPEKSNNQKKKETKSQSNPSEEYILNKKECQSQRKDYLLVSWTCLLPHCHHAPFL